MEQKDLEWAHIYWKKECTGVHTMGPAVREQLVNHEREALLQLRRVKILRVALVNKTNLAGKLQLK